MFAVAATAIVVAQYFILRSTRRGMAFGGRRAAPLLEWMYAIVPALALVVVLAWTWRTMHPTGSSAGVTSSIVRTLS